MTPKNETTWSGDKQHDRGKGSVHLYRATISCTRTVRVFVPKRVRSYVLYPGVSGYREYVIFNTPFHELVAGAYASFGLSVNCGGGEGLTKYVMCLRKPIPRFTL